MTWTDPEAPRIWRSPLADFERGGSRACGGLAIDVDEYSLAYAGPSERFLETSEAAGVLAAADPRLGFHGQSRSRQYTATSIAEKIQGIVKWAFPDGGAHGENLI